jgi:ATP adenylyltransferase
MKDLRKPQLAIRTPKQHKTAGLNLGLNLGKVSGQVWQAIHIHVVPRWNGDTNFMPILAKTKVVSIGMDEIFVKLKRSLDKLLSRRSGNK